MKLTIENKQVTVKSENPAEAKLLFNLAMGGKTVKVTDDITEGRPARRKSRQECEMCNDGRRWKSLHQHMFKRHGIHTAPKYKGGANMRHLEVSPSAEKEQSAVGRGLLD